MPTWKETIDLIAIWKNEDLEFTDQRDQIVTKLKSSRWYKTRDTAGFDERGEAVDNLAESENFDEFNDWWAQLYDYFDTDRVWIRLF